MDALGNDFTSAPSRRKPITVARAALEEGALFVSRVDEVASFSGFEDVLSEPGPWVAGLDFPFGLPRRFVDAHLPSSSWSELVRASADLGREGFSEITYAAFRAAKGRPEEKHRAVDRLARSHSPLKTMDVVLLREPAGGHDVFTHVTSPGRSGSRTLSSARSNASAFGMKSNADQARMAR